MKLPEMPSYPYIGQDWDDTARLLLGDWGKACYVAGEKQERALWELTKAGEALGEPAATPVVPPSKSAMIAICAALGFDPTNHHNAAKCPYCRPSLAASPSPRTPEQPASGLCVRCHKQPGDRVVIGTGWICAGCATADEREL